jgi:archaemetzincin
MNGGRCQIHIAIIGHVAPVIVAAVGAALEKEFDAHILPHESPVIPEIAYDAMRGQYDSSVLLDALHRETRDMGGRVLGITDIDLFAPVFTFVFGEAQLDGRVALASLYRMRNNFYGLPDDDDLLAERFTKEAVHEVGHTFGLVHCDRPSCVMHASSGVEEVDLKGPNLCDACRFAIGL